SRPGPSSHDAAESRGHGRQSRRIRGPGGPVGPLPGVLVSRLRFHQAPRTRARAGPGPDPGLLHLHPARSNRVFTNTGRPPMNRVWLAGLLPLLLAAPPCRAQDPKPADTVPASTNVQGAEYPRIHPDLRVTFRIKAPNAQKVVFAFFDSQRYPAKKGEDGFWTATTEPQVPGFHYYRVFIDGAEGRDSAEVNDPGSHTFYGTGKDASGIEIPEKGVDFYLPKDVPHGEVRERWYFSNTTK